MKDTSEELQLKYRCLRKKKKKGKKNALAFHHAVFIKERRMCPLLDRVPFNLGPITHYFPVFFSSSQQI